MAFRAKNEAPSAAKSSCCAALCKLANQLQSSLELDAIVHVIATALSETFGFREATVYLAETAAAEFRVHATVGEHPEVRPRAVQRPRAARTIWDELFLEKYQIGSSLLRRPPPARRGRRSSSTTFRRSTWAGAAPASGTPDDDLLVPLLDKKRELMGVLDLYDPGRPRLPTLELVKSLEVFATHAAVAIENARQYEQLEHATAALETPARPAPRAARAERRAPLHPGRARGVRASRRPAQGDRRLRRAWKSASSTRRAASCICGFASDARPGADARAGARRSTRA